MACVLLLTGSVAGAQKKKNDPYSAMPPLPPPKLLNPTPAQAPIASSAMAAGPSIADPAAAAPASAGAVAPAADEPVNPAAAFAAKPAEAAAPESPTTAKPSEIAVTASAGAMVNPAAMINPAAAVGTTTAATSPAGTAATTTPATPAPAPYSYMAPSTGLTHSSILNMDDYTHLLDVVLPADHRTRPGLEYTLILRFEPHIHPESQIVIRRWRDGRIETAVFRVQERNAWQAAYGKVAPGQSPDFDAVAKDVKVERKSFQLAANDEAAWRKQLMPAIQKELAKTNKKIRHIDREGVHELQMNGTRYELWYIQGDNEMHFTSMDSEVDTMTKGNFALTKWMNEVRSYADSHPTDYKPLIFGPDEAKTPRTLLSKSNKKKNKDDWQ